MTVRSDLVAQVKQAIRDVPLTNREWLSAGTPDWAGMADAAVEAVAVYVYEQLAAAEQEYDDGEE